jgi:hypothetical protein
MQESCWPHSFSGTKSSAFIKQLAKEFHFSLYDKLSSSIFACQASFPGDANISFSAEYDSGFKARMMTHTPTLTPIDSTSITSPSTFTGSKIFLNRFFFNNTLLQVNWHQPQGIRVVVFAALPFWTEA